MKTLSHYQLEDLDRWGDYRWGRRWGYRYSPRYAYEDSRATVFLVAGAVTIAGLWALTKITTAPKARRAKKRTTKRR